MLSTNRPTAGGTGTGNDVFDMVSTGPFTLNIGDSVTVAYALLAGVELTDLVNSATLAQIQYDALTTSTNDLSSLVNNVKIYPNPVNNELKLSISSPLRDDVKLKIMDASGRMINLQTKQVATGSNSFTIDITQIPTGVYYLSIQSNAINKWMQFVKQ